MRQRIEGEMPSWIRWVVRPLAEIRFNAVRARDEARGEGGEKCMPPGVGSFQGCSRTKKKLDGGASTLAIERMKVYERAS